MATDIRAESAPPSLTLRSGNQMVAEGALRAGCRFFSGYPITPASEIYREMTVRLQARGDVALGAPDEISALCYCIGASQRGAKAMTATSGPGWALMIEAFQYALMTETPVVAVLVQRLGPSTGGATQGAQGDVLLAEFATSGGYTVPVFAPSTPVECFTLTMEAFRWSEALRTPVVVLSDKEVAMTYEAVDLARLPEVPVHARPMASAEGYRPVRFGALDEVPPFAPLAGSLKVTLTGSAHNKDGWLRKNDAETLDVLRHLEAKVDARARDMAMVTRDLQEDADALVVSYGITSRAAREAVRLGRAAGRRLSFLGLLTLFPIPVEAIREAARTARRVVVAEENLSGLYRKVLAGALPGIELHGVNTLGAMLRPAEILEAL
ncbi:MAG: pyruvate flavodoxin/ferredoxin oxidoreductase [Candidatus Rokubacteria bacterium]|nr:pyruvate flavodoxin/ferredoxin oxidoreductase [Candidatus Rokubacteria bacterium]